MISLTEKEHIDYVDGSLKLIVSDSHTFGTDALLLAAFSAPKKRDTVCDFGTGCGIIPFYWLSRGVSRVHAVELQPLACHQVRRSVEENRLEDSFTLVEGDLRALKGKLPDGAFDLVTMNPPYTAEGHGIKSSTNADKIARHETELQLTDVFIAASRLLKFGGRMCICLRPERLTEAMMGMREAKIEPKRLRLVSQRDGKAPWLFLLEGKKGRNPGLIVERELHIENPDGSQSAEMLKILGAYKK